LQVAELADWGVNPNSSPAGWQPEDDDVAEAFRQQKAKSGARLAN
jgi:hypothetical protein